MIVSESQSLEVNNQARVSKSFFISEDVDEGEYVFSVLAIDESSNLVGTSSFLFNVAEKILTSPDDRSFNYYLGMAFFVTFILIIAFLLINYYWNKRFITSSKEWNKKLINVRKVKFSEIGKEIRKLEYRKELLDRAYNKGFIKRKSYEDGKKGINNLIAELKKRL